MSKRMSKGAPEATDRRRFMKQVFGTLVAGVGVALLPSAAWAATAQCCRDGSAGCPTCPGTDVKFICFGCGRSWCTCHPRTGECYFPECS